MRLVSVLSLLAAASLAVGCATGRGAARGPGDDDEWVFPEDDNDKAAMAFSAFLAEHGVTVVEVSQGGVRVADGGIRMVLEPKMGSDRELDRIIALRFFAPRDEFRGTPELHAFANTLNIKYNIGGFYVDEDGDLAFQTFVTFVDRLSWAETRGFFDWMKLTFTALVAREGEAMAKYMK